MEEGQKSDTSARCRCPANTPTLPAVAVVATLSGGAQAGVLAMCQCQYRLPTEGEEDRNAPQPVTHLHREKETTAKESAEPQAKESAELTKNGGVNQFQQ